MKYNLVKFDEVINDIITNPKNKWENNRVSPPLANLLKKESAQFKKEIKTTVFKLKSNNQIKHYIHKQQLALENLITAVVLEINPDRRKNIYKIGIEFPGKEQLRIIYLKLEKLQVFFEKEYANYLNLNRLMPYRSFLKRRKALSFKVETIRKCKATSELSFVILEIISKQLNIAYKKGITYNQFNYNTEFISELFLLLAYEKDIVSDKIIVPFLVEINYNSKAFFKFQIGKITEELNNITTLTEKVNYLLFIKKTYNQISYLGRLSYSKKRISHRKQIVNWIDEEIKYLSHTNDLEKPIPIQMPLAPTGKTKIWINMSVPQLGCIFKMMNTIGIINEQNHRDLFRFVSNSFETTHTQNISVDSLSSKYYNIEESTKEAVKSILIDLLNIVKNNF